MSTHLEPGADWPGAAAPPIRVGFLTHYFPPEVGAPQTRIDLLARTLAASGAAVTVHTGFPHYPSGRIAPPYRNRPLLREGGSGVSVVRSAVYPAPNAGFARRVANHASLAVSALATSAASGPLDVVVAETPPLFTAASGVGYAAIKRAALVVHVADRWPASAVEMGALSNPTAIAAAEALERWIYRRAEMILAPTQGIVDALEAEPAARGKVRRVWPVVDLARFDPGPPSDQGGPLRLVYVGTVGLAHGLDVLVEAARLCGRTVVECRIAGDGADHERIRGLVQERGVENVRLLGTIEAGEIPGLYARADAAAVLLRDLPIFRGALPTKLLEAMAAGRPLLLAAEGESARLVEEARAGIVVPPGDAPGLADAMRRLWRDASLRARLGRAGRAHAEAHFGRERAASAWQRHLRDAVITHQAN